MSKKKEWIELKGVRENNLKNISIKFPKEEITVVTGLSGSGKSSLVFETLFLESQRRFLDGLSNYSKNFLDNFKKPEVDELKGLSPAIAIDQKTASSSPRSTVGTMTEVLDYLRLLYARVGVPNCPHHHIPVSKSSLEEIYDWAKKKLKGKKVRVLAPVVQQKKGEFKKELKKWESLGFLKAFIDGQLCYLDKAPDLHKRKDHSIELIVDQFKYDKKLEDRLLKAIRRSFEVEEDMIAFDIDGEKKLFSIHAACPLCGFSFPELDPIHFSFNSKQGACSTCGGLGTLDIEEYEVEERLGSGGMYMNTTMSAYHHVYEDQSVEDCEDCGGTRLNERARSVFYKGKGIHELSRLSIEELLEFFSSSEKSKSKKSDAKGEPSDSTADSKIAEPILKEITKRLEYLSKVGVTYLSLDRRSETLSGGERQRLRLASQLGNPLVGVLYVLDEPSIGLHPSDHAKLLDVLKSLKEQGNTLVIVEHDEDTMRAADYLVEIGPGAGRLGGEVTNFGKYAGFVKKKSLTASYLKGAAKVQRFKKAEGLNFEKSFKIKNAKIHNLKNISLELPSQALIGVSGVSGSGKSSLVMDHLAQLDPETDKEISNFKKISKIDQKPIGKTPRSIPATYVGVFQLIRDIFCRLPESQIRGFKQGHFSFNSELGRCPECSGYGVKRIKSHFLSDISVSCESCKGERYKPEVLSVHFKSKNIGQILDMTIEEAYDFFENQKSIRRKLQTLLDVGLGYLKLGQDSTTLSGGESQRLKLSKELSKSFRGEVLYILDEPTTGLHFQDVEKLLNLLSLLVDKGHTVVVIEHQLDLLSECDYLVDMGPEGGEKGGQVVDQGPPQEVARRAKGETGKFLKAFFES